jgi:hypothetical protein
MNKSVNKYLIGAIGLALIGFSVYLYIKNKTSKKIKIGKEIDKTIEQ